MPAVPLPPSVDIQQAHWDGQSNPGALGQAATAVGQTVSPTVAGLNQASMQAQQALQGAQAKSALTDVQQKQRGMQASMLGALAQLSPEDYAAKAPTVLGSINKIGGLQYDTGMDQATARMNAMGGVPVQEQPGLQMQMYRNPYIQQQIAQTLGGNIPATNGTAGTTDQVDPRLTEARNMSILGMPDVAATDMKIYDADPKVREQQTEGVHTGENLVDAQKTFNVAASNLPRAMARFQEIRDAAGNASSGLGTNKEGGGLAPDYATTAVGQFFEPGRAQANQTINTAINQGILSELGPQLQGLKSNKFLDGIAGGATGLNFKDPADVKVHAIDQIQDQYVGNLKALAAQRRSYGDKNVPSDAEIDAAVEAEKAKYAPKNAANQAQGAFGSNRNAPQQMNLADQTQSIQNAKAAIKNGKDPAMVRQLLQSNGIDPSKAGL